MSREHLLEAPSSQLITEFKKFKIITWLVQLKKVLM